MYIYDALPKEKFIRYLVLDPGKSEEPLSGRLVTEHIDKVPEFDAISYVWGCPEKVSQINCDGKIIHLTASLQDVLKRVRHQDAARNLWADQVCINQDDITERNHQVGLMSGIYRKASSTLVWLGEATDKDADEVISLITGVEQMVKAQLKEHNGSWDDMPQVTARDLIAHDPRWASLARLTVSHWFHRVWVVQEAGLSARPHILYGNREINWELCFGVLGWLRSRGVLISQNFRILWHTIHLDRVEIWSGAYQNQKQVEEAQGNHLNPPHSRWDLLDVLHESPELRNADDRDKIYAFLGHNSASHTLTGELIVTPDYTVDVVQVYIDFAIRWLEWTQNLNILAFVQRSHSDVMTVSIPTWVPMWNTLSFQVLAQRGRRVFRAGRRNKSRIHVMKDSNRLNVQGVIFDTISYSSSVFKDDDFDFINSYSGHKSEKKSIEALRKWATTLSHVLDPSSLCIYVGNERLTTYVNTLVAGLHPRDAPEFKADAAAFLMRCIAVAEPPIHRSHIQTLGKNARGGSSQQFEMEIGFTLLERRFITTKKGYYGIAPSTVREGDSCCVLFGAKTPFIIRDVAGSPGQYELIGESYVHGVVHGEIVEMCLDGLLQEEDIILV